MARTRNHCDVCNQEFDTPEELREHQARHHTSEGQQAQSKDRSQEGSSPKVN